MEGRERDGESGPEGYAAIALAAIAHPANRARIGTGCHLQSPTGVPDPAGNGAPHSVQTSLLPLG